MSNLWSDIFNRNLWKGKESRSGPGSDPWATELLRRQLPALVEELKVTTMLNVGCGDDIWMPDLTGIEYTGCDIAPEAVYAARARHPEWRYYVTDARIPGNLGNGWGDLVLCRDVLTHLSLDDGLTVLSNVRGSGAKWLLTTTFQHAENVDIESGHGWHRVNMEHAPFDLGTPQRLIQEGWEDKFLGLWAL